jgi:monoamine oxidase
MLHAMVTKNVGVCIVGSNLAKDLDGVGGSALIDYALATMESMFGSAVSGAFVKGNNSSWLNDPYSRGAYTYATRGAVPLRTALATPVGNQVFFAGEALPILKHSSLAQFFARRLRYRASRRAAGSSSA